MNEETTSPEKILCPGCGWEYPPEKMQNFTTKVNLRDGTQEELLFCDPVCTDFWDEYEPGEWVPLGTVWPIPGREGQEVQLALWTCSVCSGVYDCNMVKLLVDTEWNDDKLHVCSFCEKKEKGRYKPQAE
jgi:rubredoxin